MDHPAYNVESAQFIFWFHSYKKSVHDYICYLTGDEQAAQDLTQDLFIKVWLKRERLNSIENISSYLHRMAHNAAMTWFSSVARDARLAGEVTRHSIITNNNVKDSVDLKETQALLQQAVTALSPQRRKVFELSRTEGWKIERIAGGLGISVSTAKNHLKAALAYVRHFYLENTDKAVFLLLTIVIYIY